MKKLYLSLLGILCLLGTSTSLFASHAAGGEIIYELVPGTTNQYKFTFKFYRDCSGIAEPNGFAMCYSNNCGVTNQTLNVYKIVGNLPNGKPNGSPITLAGCYNQPTICEGGVLTGYREWWYTGIVTLNTTCNYWKFWVQLCCRNGGIGNVVSPVNQNIFIETTFDNTTNLNSSPYVASPPIAYYCINTPSYAYYTAIDPDGDSLVYESIAPRHNNTGCGNYAPVNIFTPAYNIAEPFPTGNTFNINPVTGVISFTPTMQGLWVFTVKIKEYRNGQYIGFIMRDIQFVVSVCNLPPPLSVFATYAPIQCNGASTSVTATGNGGIAPYQYKLNGGAYQASNQFNGITAGIYTITVMDANNCTSTSAFFVTQPAPFALNVNNIVNPQCNMPCTGTAQATASGGVQNYSFTITAPGQINANTGAISALCAGSYTVTATDANNCSATAIISVTQPMLGANVTGVTNIICNGYCNATAQANNIGGLNPIIYSISPSGTINAANGAISGLCAGTYTVTITDANLCTGTSVFTVSEPPALIISVSNITGETCNGLCNGSSQSLASGGTAPYSYSISAPGNVAPATGLNTGLCAGTYTVTVTDANLCVATTTFSIAPTPILTITVNNITNVSCSGLCDGTSLSVATGGTQPFTYAISAPGVANAATGANSGLCAGTYTVTVADGNNCSASNTFTVAQPQPLSLSVSNITNLTCFAPCDGTAQAGAAGGTSPYTYGVNVPGVINVNTGALTGLCAGSHTITAADANGCTATTTMQISQSPPVIWTGAVSTNVTCNGAANGTIATIATGGTGTISYNLQPGNQNNAAGQFAGLTAGTYTVTATDINNCTTITTLVVSQPPALQITNIANTLPTCVPGNDGSMTITASGGTPAYSYNIGGANQLNNVFNNLGTGNYFITVTDANGCAVTTSQNMTNPNPPAFIGISIANVSCYGGNNASITTSAMGGGGLNYTLMPNNQNNATGLFTNLIAGVYTVIVGDANGCTASSSLTIIQPLQLAWTISNVTNINCNGGSDGSIAIGAAGGTGAISYTLLPGNQTNATGLFSSLSAGIYTMTASDANGCSLSTILQISQPALLTWVNAASSDVSCNGGTNGSISANATGGTGIITYNLLPTNQNNAIGQFANLTAGSYTVTAVDANNCSISSTFIISQPGTLQITNIASTQPTCVPGNDATITVTTAGGTPQFNYNIGGANQANNVFNNIGGGNYIITVTDANGCTASSSQSIIPPNAPVITGILITDVTCNGGNNATITTTATGGAGLNYTLQPTNQTNVMGLFTNLVAGIYTIIVSDANGCTTTGIAAVIQPAALNWTVTNVTAVNCNGGSDGAINTTATGGTGAISYTLQPNNITNGTGIFSSLSAGTYTITAMDASNCSLSISLQVTQPQALNWASINSTNVNCNGGADGTLSATATGGTGIINYNLQPGNQTNVTGQFGNSTANTYTVQATDANGCIVSTTIAITEPAILQIISITNTQPTCVPGNDASMTVTATGGLPTYSYNIGGANQANNLFTNLGAGTYTIAVTDANGCIATGTQSITPPSLPLITNTTATEANCSPGNNGTVTITAIGGTGTYTYSSDGINFQLSNTINALSPGNYTVTVKDASGCTSSSIIVISITPSPIITNVAVTTANCVPGCNGTATIFASGGNGIYTYSANGINFQPNNLIAGLCTNIYTATVVDGNGCTATGNFIISTASSPTITLNNTVNVLCNGGNNGAISVTAIGTGAINYLLLPGGITNATGLFNNLTANNYTVQATDANGCSVSTVVLITQPSVVQFTNIITNGALCSGANNGSINITTTGGTGVIAYSINPLANFVAPAAFNNLIGNTTYTVTATDANGCSVTSSVFVSQPLPVVFTNTSFANVDCSGGNNGSITLQAAGGTGILNYNLAPNPQNNLTGIFNNLNANTYTVTVTDANSCTISTIIIITEPLPVTLNTISGVDVSCSNLNNGIININCSGGTGVLTYNLQPGNITNNSGLFSNLAGNTYSIIVTDANGCSYSTNATIANPQTLFIDTLNITNVVCSGGSSATIYISVSGGTGIMNYNLLPQNINNATGQFSALSAGVYTITITDANLCNITTSVTISEPLPLTASVLGVQHISCSGANTGQINVGANGGTTPYAFTLMPVNLTNANGVFTNLIAGSYVLNVTDANLCPVTVQPIVITEPMPVKFESTTTLPVKCFGDSTGTISVTASGGTGNIIFSLLPNIGLQSPAGNFSLLNAGTYTIIATDANNCTMSTTVTVNQNPETIIHQITFVTPRCWGEGGGIIHLSATGGIGQLHYYLNNQNACVTGFFNDLSGGNYLATVKDSLGCKKDSVVSLLQPDKIYLSSLEISPVYCKGYSDGKIFATAAGGNGGYTYYLRPGLSVNSTGYFEGLHEGSYSLTIKDSLGCKLDTVLFVSPPLSPLKVIISKKDLGCYGTGNEGWAQANLSGGTEPYTYLWHTVPAQYEAKATTLEHGKYVVEITDSKGCKAKDSVYIDPGPCCDEVFMPNAFSPNGDGNNDLFKVTTSTGLELQQFEIYDRWGKKIWYTNDFRKGWDGTESGQDRDMNTYYYILRYKCLADGEDYVKKGDINLIR